MTKNLIKPFLLILVLLVLVGCYMVYRPFLTEIFIAAILASVFYTPYQSFTTFLKGRRHLAAVLMCLLLLILIILPTIKAVSYAGEKSVVAYNASVAFFEKNSASDLFASNVFTSGPLSFLIPGDLDTSSEAFKNTILDVLKQSSNWLLSGATMVVRGTTNFIISLILIIISMYFFFVDGEKMLSRLMRLSPLPSRYDRELFKKFRAVSRATFISTFVAAIGQGVIGAIGFAIVGFPAFLAGVLVALLSLLPYIGSAIFYVPVGVYYFLIGEIWRGIFVILWGALLISTVDNIIRTYMVKGDAEINPIFVLFSILGGIILFGFWGVILGPLIVALAVTVFHIYEMEFCQQLDGADKDDAKPWANS